MNPIPFRFENQNFCAIADEPGGRERLLAALRQVAAAQGVAEVAARAGLQRESLYRAFSSRGNPALKTLPAVLSGVGLRLSVEKLRREPATA